MWRGRGAGFGAWPPLEQRGHVFRLAPATTDLDESAHNSAHHVAEKAVPRDFIREDALSITPDGSGNCARGSVGLTARALEGSEIMRSDECGGAPFHGRAIHVYGGDFFEPPRPRSEWDPETLDERPWDIEHTRQLFAAAEARSRV